MDEKLENLLCKILATQGAHRMLIDTLLTQTLAQLSKPTREGLGQAVIGSSKRTEALHGKASNDFEAARLADMVIETQSQVEDAINRALKAADTIEDHMNQRG